MIEPQSVLRNVGKILSTYVATDVRAAVVPHEVVDIVHDIFGALTPFERALLTRRFGLWAHNRRSLLRLAIETDWTTSALSAAVDVALWKMVLVHGMRLTRIASVKRRCRRVSIDEAFRALFTGRAPYGYGRHDQRLLVRIEMPVDALVAPRTEVMLSLGQTHSVGGVLVGPPETLPWNVLSMVSPVVYSASTGGPDAGTIPTSIGPVAPLSVELYVVAFA